MLVFITSLRHPQNSTSYEKIEYLLQRTLQSVSQQTNQDFRIIVVCNRLPKQHLFPPKVEFISVDFPAPSTIKGTAIDLEDVHKDKGSKYFVGLLHAKKYNPNYIMFFDSDDFISNRIVEYVNSQPEQNGWFIQHGYAYGDGLPLIRELQEFDKKCGTCHILNFNLFDLPNSHPPHPSQDWIFQVADSYFVKKILGAHIFTRRYFNSIEKPLKPLPFPGAVYVVGTGENHTGNSLRGFARPISRKVSKEFYLIRPKLELSVVRNVIFKYMLPKISRKLRKI